MAIRRSRAKSGCVRGVSAACRSHRRRGPPVELLSSETRTRVGASRVVIRFNFEFRQKGQLVYVGDQSAIFVKGKVVG